MGAPGESVRSHHDENRPPLPGVEALPAHPSGRSPNTIRHSSGAAAVPRAGERPSERLAGPTYSDPAVAGKDQEGADSKASGGSQSSKSSQASGAATRMKNRAKAWLKRSR